MIVFFVGRAHRGTLTSFLDSWGSRLAPKVRLVSYEHLPHLAAVPAAHAYVFTDLERRLHQRPRLGELADRLLASPGEPLVLNHPRGVLGRFELLRALHERGVNPFAIHPAVPGLRPRFPVFVRDPDEHNGPLTPLLRTQAELDAALRRLRRWRLATGRPLAVLEWEDTRRPDGFYRKHLSYVLGDEILHGNLCFNRHWVVKYGGAVAPEQLAEQAAEWTSTEHVPTLRELARLAGVRYGRFDYTVVDGSLRIWELNTNPTLLQHASVYTPELRERRGPLAERITDALDRLDGGAGSELDRPPVRLHGGGARRMLLPLAPLRGRTRDRLYTRLAGGVGRRPRPAHDRDAPPGAAQPAPEP